MRIPTSIIGICLFVTCPLITQNHGHGQIVIHEEEERFISHGGKSTVISAETVEEERRKRETPLQDDLVAQVTDTTGKPISGLKVALLIKRANRSFTGSGVPRVIARRASDDKGQVRFSRDQEVEARISSEIASTRAVASQEPVSTSEYDAFRGFNWKLVGYSRKHNFRIELFSAGAQKVWGQTDQVKLIIPELTPITIRVVSDDADHPLVAVRVRVDGVRISGDNAWKVQVHTWSDVHGAARVWLPEGKYRFMYSSQIASLGCREHTAESSSNEFPEFEVVDEKTLSEHPWLRNPNFLLDDRLPEILVDSQLNPEPIVMRIPAPLPFLP